MEFGSRGSSWSLTHLTRLENEKKREKEYQALSLDGSGSGSSFLVNKRMIPRMDMYSIDIGMNKSDALNNTPGSTICMYLPHLSTKLKYFNKLLPDKVTTFDPTKAEVALEKKFRRVAIVAGRNEQNIFKLHFFLNDRCVWSAGREIPIPALPKRCLAVSGQHLYLIGGEIGAIPDEIKSRNLFIFNMRTKELSEGPSLRIPRCDAGVGVWNDTLYLAGGLNRYNHPLTHVDAYDMRQNAWCLIQAMKFPRYRPGMIIVDGVIYVIGGHTTHCEWYPIESGRIWAELPKLPAVFGDLGITATYFKDWIIAFRNYRPDRVAVLDRVTKEEWDVLRTTGEPPGSIEDSFTHEGSCYVLTSNGNLFELHLAKLVWYKSVNCPKSMNKVYHIACAQLHNVTELIF